VFQVHALANPADLDIQIALNLLERDLLASVIDGEVNFAEPTHSHASFNCEAGKGLVTVCVSELHFGVSIGLRWIGRQ
jgi:hypothetical protein